MQTKREIFEQIGLDLEERFMEAVLDTEDIKPPKGLMLPIQDPWEVGSFEPTNMYNSRRDEEDDLYINFAGGEVCGRRGGQVRYDLWLWNRPEQ